MAAISEPVDAYAQLAFNGGKMNSLYQLVFSGDESVPKWKRKCSYGEKHVSEAAARALKEGPARIKIHGECSLLLLEDNPAGGKRWGFYMRRDRYKAQEGEIVSSLPSGVQPDVFQKHEYSLIRLPEDRVTGKGKKKSATGPDTYAAIAFAVSSGAIPDPNADDAPPFISVEWIGRKHQNNSDDINADHAIAVHSEQAIHSPPRTREELEIMARDECIEGLVYQDPETGERFKFKFENIEGSPAKELMSGKRKSSMGCSAYSRDMKYSGITISMGYLKKRRAKKKAQLDGSLAVIKKSLSMPVAGEPGFIECFVHFGDLRDCDLQELLLGAQEELKRREKEHLGHWSHLAMKKIEKVCGLEEGTLANYDMFHAAYDEPEPSDPIKELLDSVPSYFYDEVVAQMADGTEITGKELIDMIKDNCLV